MMHMTVSIRNRAAVLLVALAGLVPTALDAQVQSSAAASPDSTTSSSAAEAKSQPTAAADDAADPVAKELAEMRKQFQSMKEGMQAMQARMEQLEATLREKAGQKDSAADPQADAQRRGLLATTSKDPGGIPIMPGIFPKRGNEIATLATPSPQSVPLGQSAFPTAQEAQAPPAPAVDTQTPFADADWTWLNGNSRQHDSPLDSKYFSGEFRADTFYGIDFNQPKDHSMGGSSEVFRNGEVQLEDLSIGGDFHAGNMRGRVLGLFGMFSATTVRNDASPAVGQWDVRAAYKYVSEAYGGYHFNVQHGLNVDAGIFVSYIGLFSYYNLDNWTYQPSYVSSNTPWFFNGVRVQWFPTNKLKIEPWFVNGWQSYAKYNGHPGLGGQLLWMPREWFKLVANQYGFGQDNLGLPKTERIHTDDSIEVRYYNNPEKGLDKMAFSLTADAGCQYGGGIQCLGAPSNNKSTFIGWMLYDRMWFKKDLFALTLGGGEMSNWGRYLTLLPPIDGADAVSGSPYFTESPGQRAHMWDSTVTLQYMPKQYITWWLEAGYRHSDVPYFAGRGGVTPPGGNNGSPGQYACSSGAASGTNVLSQAYTNCGGLGGVWYPDLRRSEMKLSIGVMVKF